MVHFFYPGSGVVHDCIHSYLYPFSYRTTNFPRLLDHASFIRSADIASLTQKMAIERMCHVFIPNKFNFSEDQFDLRKQCIP